MNCIYFIQFTQHNVWTKKESTQRKWKWKSHTLARTHTHTNKTSRTYERDALVPFLSYAIFHTYGLPSCCRFVQCVVLLFLFLIRFLLLCISLNAVVAQWSTLHLCPWLPVWIWMRFIISSLCYVPAWCQICWLNLKHPLVRCMKICVYCVYEKKNCDASGSVDLAILICSLCH